MPARLSDLMRDSFLVDPLSLAEDCWVRDAMTVSRDDFGTAIDIVQAAGGGDDLVARLVAQHPIGSAHRIEHDERVLDVFAEVEAFAWGLTNRLGVPCFVPGEGFPDIATDCGWWIEAKAINRSAAEQAIRRRMVNVGSGIRGPRELKRGSEGCGASSTLTSRARSTSGGTRTVGSSSSFSR